MIINNITAKETMNFMKYIKDYLALPNLRC